MRTEQPAVPAIEDITIFFSVPLNSGSLEKRAEKIMKIFCKISIEETSKKDKLELEKWKKIIKD